MSFYYKPLLPTRAFQKTSEKLLEIFFQDTNDKIITDYNISESYITMFAKNYLFAATYSENYRINATNFTDKFKTNSLKNKFEKPNYKFVYEKEQNLKSQEREFYETLKNMEGYTSKINEILEKIEDENKKKYYIIHNSNAILKSFSNVFIVLRIADFIIFDEDKTSKDYADFAKDVTDLTNTIAGVIALKGSKTSIETIQSLSKAIYETNNSKTFLSNITFANRVAIITTIITTIYDMNELYKKEDYDAMFLTLFISGTTLALLFFSPALPITVVTILLNIINMAILTQIKDSDLKIYLQKSLLFKKDIGVFEVFFQNKEKRYKTHYLLEAVKTIDNLKTKVNDGFNDPTKIIDFIGKNYLSYEKYFDMALTNELSFLKANLFGYKLEKTSYKNSSNIRNPRNIDIRLKINSAVKVPKVLYDDEKFKLFVINTDNITANNPENNYKKFSNVSKNNIPIINGNPIFNPFGSNNQYFDLNDFINYKLPRKIYTAYIIITSSVIDLKYEVKYLASKTSTTFSSVVIEIDIDELEQISFDDTDINILQGIK